MPVLIPLKEYHTLTDLCPIVNLKYRQLQERVKIVSKKYKDEKSLIFKKSNIWFIHNKIIKEFKRKRNPIDYKLFITINSRNKFEADYWKFFIYQLNKKLKKTKSIFFII